MLSAYNAMRKQVIARDTVKAAGPFSCPDCKGEVRIKKGTEVVHHFAHTSVPLDCSWREGESKEHRQAKLSVYDTLFVLSDVDRLMIERVVKHPLYTVRLDVSCRIRKQFLLTIELQFSGASPKILSRRTRYYTNSRIHVLWLLPFPEKLWAGEIYTTKQMERYMQALYNGTVYYWIGGDLVQLVHFRKYSLGKVYRQWYDAHRRKKMEGYVEQYPKNHSMIPEFHEIVRITDLQPFTRKAEQVGPYALPAARLWGIEQPLFETRS